VRSAGGSGKRRSALVLVDYQPEMIDHMNGHDPKLVKVNVRTMATMAVRLGIPVVLSTVGVERGFYHPTIPSLQAALPDVTAIDRSTMVAWDDPVFRSAVQATGKNRVVAGALYTQTCLAYTCVELLADGYQVGFVEDAVGDTSQQEHDIAARRLTQAGAVPYTTRGIMNEWWRGDFTSESAAVALELYGKYFAEIEAVTGRPAMFRPREDAATA
jgi:nicotinamidase-related amidase